MVQVKNVQVRYAQVTVNPNRGFVLVVHVEPSFRSELVSIPAPHVLVPVTMVPVSIPAVPTSMRVKRLNVQIISNWGDCYGCPRGDKQLFIDLSRNANNWL